MTTAGINLCISRYSYTIGNEQRTQKWQASNLHPNQTPSPWVLASTYSHTIGLGPVEHQINYDVMRGSQSLLGDHLSVEKCAIANECNV